MSSGGACPGGELTQTDLVRIAKWGAKSNLSAKELPHIVADAAAVARGAGLLSDEEFVKLWKTGLSPTIRMKEKVRHGNDLYYVFAFQNRMAGHAVASRVRFICKSLTLDGRAVQYQIVGNREDAIANAVSNRPVLYISAFNTSNTIRGHIASTDLRKESLGHHLLRFTVQYELALGSRLPSAGDLTGEVVVERQFELVSPDQPTVRLFTDPLHEERASKGMVVSFGADGNFFEATPSIPVEPPIAMAYRVYFQNANLRIAVGSWTSGIFEQSMIISGLRVKDRPTEFVDELEIIFEPDPELAEQGPLVNEIWGKPRTHRFGTNPAR